MSEGLFNAFNYLVPATGTVKGYNIQTDFSTPYQKNWQQTDVDADEFHPSGVFVDNTTSANPLTITILETGQKIVIAAGGVLQTMYPAPVNHTVRITGGNGGAGSGNASVTFVDFPVIPYQYGATTIASGGDVTEGSTTDAAVTGDNPGTISAKLRGLNKILFSIWDSVNNLFRVGGNVASGVADVGNPVKVGGVYHAVLPNFVDGQRGDLQLFVKGSLAVTPTDSVSGNAASFTNGSMDGVNPLMPGFTNSSYGLVYNGSTWDRDARAISVSKLSNSAASTNATLVKNAPGVLHSFEVYNNNAGGRWLKFYNKATAPVVGTDVPVRSTFCPPNTRVVFSFPRGLNFNIGLGYAMVVNGADTDSTPVAANDFLGLNIDYY